jgi:hypothetical protein
MIHQLSTRQVAGATTTVFDQGQFSPSSVEWGTYLYMHGFIHILPAFAFVIHAHKLQHPPGQLRSGQLRFMCAKDSKGNLGRWMLDAG